MMSNVGNSIKVALAARTDRMTVAQLADRVGTTLGKLNNVIYGRARPSEDLIGRIRTELNLPLNWPIEDPPDVESVITSTVARRTITFAGYTPAGDWGNPLESMATIELDAKFDGPKRFATKMVGDSCYPFLMPGDIAVWQSDMDPPYGAIVLAQRKGDRGCTVKHLEYDDGDGRPRLKPLNQRRSEPEDGDGWGVIARLIGVNLSDSPARCGTFF